VQSIKPYKDTEMNKSRRHKNKLYAFAGGGMSLGAAFGILFGMLLFDNPWYGPIIGAALGLMIGAAFELFNRLNHG
jgi:uncharacterized membrane protein